VTVVAEAGADAQAPAVWVGVRLISLADMIAISLAHFAGTMGYLVTASTQLAEICRYPTLKHKPPPAPLLQLTGEALLLLKQQAVEVGLRGVAKRASQIHERVVDETHDWSSGELFAEIRQLNGSLNDSLQQLRAFRVPSNRNAYIDLPAKWNELGILDAFPEAYDDIRCAGECYAVELNTASVFHSMRIAQHGLVWLAKKLKVKLRDKGKPIEITEATWNKIIVELKKHIELARTLPASAQKRELLERCATAANNCEYMKDMWRNDVAHAHKPYSSDEAGAAVTHVRDYMQHLATMDLRAQSFRASRGRVS
jgi:hypothetical protein